MKYYAVRKGFNPGIYTDWEECEKQVNGFIKPEFKKFSNKQDAIDYINGIKDIGKNRLDLSVPNAFVDGSYNPELDVVGAGFILLLPDGTEIKKSYWYPNIDNMRNVIGELYATVSAVEECIRLGFKDIIIHYDYQGIESWVTGNWRANRLVTHDYKEIMLKLSKEINIQFVKVKAHAGTTYNEIADRLANEAIEQYKFNV
jgi:viroplasmin and RNaseH domain-containing protein